MNRLGACLLLALAAGPAPGQETSDLAPKTAPAPLARPGEAGGGEVADGAEAGEVPAAEEPTAVDGTFPDAGDRPALIPPEEMRPAEPSAGLDAAEPPALAPPEEADPGQPAPREEPAGPPQPEVLAESPEDMTACLAALDSLGVAYEREEPLREPDNPGCGMMNPLTVTALGPGVALEPPSVMRCATALAGARWIADVVAPLSGRLDRGDLTAIDQGTAYLCRPRADGEMSEHAWGNALDVMGFRFADGEPIAVQPRAGDGTLEEAFQRVVRAGACLDFATVLGPGSDADHADHLHFDIKARTGGFRICE